MAVEIEIGDTINIPLNWHISDEIISRYATNMTFQLDKNEFTLFFLK